MGDVYEAWDEELGISGALKVLRFGRDSDALLSLKQEAMLARAVVHPNVCRVYDLSCHGDPKDGIWFLTMEVLRGETLANRLRMRGRITPGEAGPLVEQMAAGLEAAHQSGVAHLDFKSANVMLVGDPGRQQAVITDFGLARNVRQSHEESPREASAFKVIAGTPAYMAPEQVRGEVAGPAADIYSLGIVLYEMVTGVLPFASGTELEVAERRLEGKAPSPRSVVPELDERWEAVIRRCLEREPRRRFARALDVSEALAGYHLAHVSLAGSSQSQHSLPVERDLFVGREVDLAAIERTITGGARLATLLGAAGMGKTRLVIHYGWLKLADWPGGVWFCDLTQARDVNGITSAVGRALGTPLGKGDPVAQLGYALAGRGRCLVILDNLEQTTVAAATTVQQWLERAPKAHFLATSRERLGLASESILQVTPMDLEPGLELFVDRAKRLRPGLELDEAELAAAGEVVHLADGIPLAIELAGARMRVMSAAQILAGMRKRFSLLTGGQSERHETLAVALDGSWELLRPWERAAFAQCSVFEGGFTLAAADSVLDLSSYADAPWPVDAVQALLDKSLLRAWVPETGANPGLPGPRFGMYVSLQEYARGKLATEGAVPQGESGHRAVRAAEDRHGRWYGRFGTEQALAELDRHHGMDKRLALSNEMANFTAATRRGLKRQDGEIATTAYLAAAAASYVRGPFGAVVDLGREVIASPLSRDERALVLAALGGMERESGKMQDGRIHLEAALALHRELGRRRTAGNALNSLGNLHLTQGRSDEARAHYEAALAAHREVGNRLGEGIVLGNLGLLHADQSREEALRFYEAALAIHRENSNRRFEGTVLGYLGNLHLNHGRIDEARAHYEAALGIHREMGNRFNEGTLLGNLGILHHEQGRMQDAQAYFLAALTIHREVGNRRSEGTVLGFLGDLYLEQGLMKEARIHLDAALAIHREVGHRTYEGVITGNLGCLHLGQGRTTEARAHYEVALAIARELGTRREEGIALYYLGNLHFGDGRMEEARANYEAALAIAHEVGDQRGVGLVLNGMGNLYLGQDRLDEARVKFESGLAIHRELGYRLFEGTFLLGLGNLSIGQGNLEEARTHYEAALAIHREFGNRRLEGVVLGKLSDVLLEQGRPQEAKATLGDGEALLRTAEDAVELATLLCVRVKMERASGKLASARASLREAEALASRVGFGPGSQLSQLLTKLRQTLT